MNKIYEFVFANGDTLLVRGRLLTDEDNFMIYDTNDTKTVIDRAVINYYKVTDNYAFN
jgi:hypothetical protein